MPSREGTCYYDVRQRDGKLRLPGTIEGYVPNHFSMRKGGRRGFRDTYIPPTSCLSIISITHRLQLVEYVSPTSEYLGVLKANYCYSHSIQESGAIQVVSSHSLQPVNTPIEFNGQLERFTVEVRDELADYCLRLELVLPALLGVFQASPEEYLSLSHTLPQE